MLKKHAMTCALSLLILTSATTARAHDAAITLPDDHAPIGVMGDHAHKQGEWMLSYRYARMEMSGSRTGTTDISPASVLTGFMVAPLQMTMDMHMFGAMYGVSDNLTIMGMLPYMRKEMSSVNVGLVRFKTQSEGIGDAKLSALLTLYDKNNSTAQQRKKDKLLLKLGASLPTGSTDKRDTTPMGNVKLAYPMQLGSGTVDPMLGITFTQRLQNWSWGAQGNTVFRFGSNSDGYRLGNEYGATGWVARNLNDSASLSFRLEGKRWGDIHGRDPALNPAMMPAARTDLRAGTRVDAAVGVNFYRQGGTLDGHRLALELAIPVYQDLDGPQLKSDYRLTAGWQKAF
jgi:hypothetical protein